MIENKRALIRVSAALASPDVEALTEALGWASQVADPRQVEEVILQFLPVSGISDSAGGDVDLETPVEYTSRAGRRPRLWGLGGSWTCCVQRRLCRTVR